MIFKFFYVKMSSQLFFVRKKHVHVLFFVFLCELTEFTTSLLNYYAPTQKIWLKFIDDFYRYLVKLDKFLGKIEKKICRSENNHWICPKICPHLLWYMPFTSPRFHNYSMRTFGDIVFKSRRFNRNVGRRKEGKISLDQKLLPGSTPKFDCFFSSLLSTFRRSFIEIR